MYDKSLVMAIIHGNLVAFKNIASMSDFVVRTCNSCGKPVPIIKFVFRQPLTGRLSFFGRCVDCRNQMTRTRYHCDPTYREAVLLAVARRRGAIESRERRTGFCITCGKSLPSNKMKYCRTCNPYGISQRHVSCCITLQEHHEDLKDDPERLTTDFIKSLSRCQCKENQYV